MQTKYFRLALAVFSVSIVFLTLMLIIWAKFGKEVSFGKAMERPAEHSERVGVGDCFADGATGDFYTDAFKNPQVNCQDNREQAFVSDFSSFIHWITATLTPEISLTKTPQPKHPVISAPTLVATDVPTMSATNKPDVPGTEITPKPSQTPVPPPTKVTSTPEPTEKATEEPTEEPEETSTPEPAPTKECKNKNQFKDGTPDCNAGGGND